MARPFAAYTVVVQQPESIQILPEWQIECMQVIANDSGLSHHEENVTKQPYDISSWVVYLDSLDDRIEAVQALESRTEKKKESKATIEGTLEKNWIDFQLRDLVGRRALSKVPRSYKLWKLQWEFLFNWEKRFVAAAAVGEETTTPTVTSFLEQSLRDIQGIIVEAFERALWTLHAYPRVWMVYLQWLHSRPHVISTTRLRRIVNRALQATPVTQHSKVWPIILDLFYGNSTSSSNSENNKDQHDKQIAPLSTAQPPEKQWDLPLESRIRILKRYTEFNPTFSTELADWLMHQPLHTAIGTSNNNPSQWAGAAALLYQTALNSSSSSAALTSSRQRQEAWMAFLNIGSQYPKVVQKEAGIPWERIVRSALHHLQEKQTKKWTMMQKGKLREEQDGGDAAATSFFLHTTTSSNEEANDTTLIEGWLWTQLADSWIRQGQFDAARSIYEEGLQSVHKVRDFSILYDAYLQLEEGLLTAATSKLEETMEDVDDENNGEDEATNNDEYNLDLLLSDTTYSSHQQNVGGATFNSRSLLADMEWAMARAEHLTKRRPLLLNQVMLRQNPNNVAEWLHRAQLYLENQQPGQAASALEEGLKTVHAPVALNGNPSEMVVQLAKIYSQVQGNVSAARDLFDRICLQEVYRFRKADDLAECWVTWIELELSQEAWDEALSLARQSVAPKRSRYVNLTKSLRLWDLLLDLEESLGTDQTTKDMYNRVIEIKAATVQHILNFANFLTEKKYFEESFTAYERGIEMFDFPHPGAKLLWKAYLDAFQKRFKGTKMERMRDLFQRCLESCPPEECSEFFIMNGKFEEEHGLAKRALSVYRSMCQKVPKEEKLAAYQLFIVKTIKYFGLAATRDIYQEAIEKLQDQDAAKLCLEFCATETSLQQPERARAILAHGAQLADPRRMPEYWKTWNEFEIAHGNEDSFREMLRVKRSVEAAFSTVNYNATGMSDKVETLRDDEAMRMIAAQEGVDLDTTQDFTIPLTSVKGFVPSKRSAAAASLDDVEERAAKLRKATTASGVVSNKETNEDEAEIDIDDIDAEIEAAAAEGEEEELDPSKTSAKGTAAIAQDVQEVSTKAIPAAVFGGLATEEPC